MYINFNKFKLLDLSEIQVFLLCAIKNKAVDYLQEHFEEHREYFESKGFVKYIKGKKDTPKYELVRLDKKGEKLLKELSSSLEVSEDNKRLGEWLITFYKNRKGGIVKNKTETLRRLQWFSDQTGLERNDLAVLLKLYIQDTFVGDIKDLEEAKTLNPRLHLSNEAGNIFWRPLNHLQKHYKLDESPLYEYYTDFREYFEKHIEKLNASNK